ncbi:MULTISPECIES: hypothetical protein [Lonsdalea]|uniref:hypothetical protein n=1 Tax=Lonsdalea TaxID=1082702 RepID=UPI00142DD5DD|nr:MULTISPECIES: hypothetical protein [Lonsdalea]
MALMRLFQRVSNILQTVNLFAVFFLNAAALLAHVFVGHHTSQLVRKPRWKRFWQKKT